MQNFEKKSEHGRSDDMQPIQNTTVLKMRAGFGNIATGTMNVTAVYMQPIPTNIVSKTCESPTAHNLIKRIGLRLSHVLRALAIFAESLKTVSGNECISTTITLQTNSGECSATVATSL